MSSYIEGFEDGVRATKAEYLKLLEEESYPVKELTDEEIAEIAMQCSDMDEYGNSRLKEYEFARAILRKASEK